MRKTFFAKHQVLALLVTLVAAQPFMASAQTYGYQVPLEGSDQSISQGQLSITPGAHNFGTLVMGSTAATTVVVRNTGQDGVTITGFTLPAPFAQSNSCPSTLVGGASCNVNVTYSPQGAGNNSATLAISTSEPTAQGSLSLSGNAVVPTTNLSLSVSTVDFGATDVNATATPKSVTVTNNGNSPATVNGVGVTGSEFNQSNNCGSPLAPGASCTVSLSFVPAAYGSRSGNLSLFEQASGTLYNVALTGSGNAAVLAVSPASLDLGSAITNYANTTAQATYTNVGNRDITGLSLSTSLADYTVSAQTCTPILTPGSSCTATVRFAPTVAGARTASLNAFTANAGSAAVSLSGTGTAQSPAASVSASSLAFGSTPVDGSSVAQQVTFSNTGNVPVSLGGVTVAAGTTHYSVSTSCGASLAVGATCSASVTFSPRAAGPITGTLRATFSSGNVDVTLSGTGSLAEATVSPTSLSFADQQIASTSAVKTVTVTNTGNRKLTVSGVSIVPGGSNFSQSNNCSEVLPAATCTVNVTITPTGSGPRTAVLALVHDGANGTTTVDLAGVGRVQSATISTPTFAATAVGASSTGTALLSNTGVGALDVILPSTSAVTGAGYSFVSTACGTTVAVGSSCLTTVRFSPTTTAATSGSLKIVTGAGQMTTNFGSTGIQGFASVNPSSLSYSAQQVGTMSAAKVVTVTNTGTDTLTFTGVGISYGDAEFGQTNNCGSVAVGGTCTVNVAFTPTNTGNRLGTLSFTHNGGGIANVDLSGMGQAQSATLTDVSFGGVSVGSTPTLTSTLTNTGIGILTVTPPAAGSVSSAHFSFVSTNCGSTLAVGASCTTTVRFSPATGGPKSGSLAIATGGGLLNAALTGTGNQAVLSFSYPGSNAVDWGNRQAGGVYGSGQATLTNTGNSTATGITITPSSVWSLYSNTCTSTLTAGQACTFYMNFSPASIQAYSGSVTATATSTVVANQLTLSGSGVAQTATLSTPAFAATPVGSNSTAVATLTNTGLGALSVTVPTSGSVSGGAYSFASTDCASSLAASASCSVTVRFSPSSTTAASGSLSIGTGAGIKTATLSSTGIQGFASMSPGSLTFGTTAVGSSSAAQSITVTNTGNSTLTFSGVGIASGGSNYGSSNNCGSVAVGGTCTVSVSFSPTTTGSIPGSVGFTHNGGGAAVVSLSGTGASYSWVSGSWATPSACGATTSTRTVSCQRNDGATVADGLCSGAKPATSQAATDYGSCSYNFQYSAWSTPASCGAVTQTRTATCQRSDGTTVANSFCGTPVTSQAATDYSSCTYAFQYGAWDTPSGCGTVTQTRSASCQRSDGTTVANSYCGTPTTSQSTTSTSSCNYTWQTSGYTTPAACGSTTATRSVWCQRSDGTTVADSSCSGAGAKPASSTSTTDYSACSYSWQSSGWSSPSGCGSVTQTRTVWCQRGDGTTVADGNCGGGKPATSQGSTSYSSCTYSFNYGSWSSPSGCGSVTQTRTASCQRSDGTTVANSNCGTPVTSQSSTDYSSCTYSYSYGGWSSPSGCGTVTQTRSATCYRSDGTPVANSNCGTATTSQSATDYSSCSYSASYGGWSTCSNSCGAGTQTRSASCQRSDGTTVANSSCGSMTTSQSCTGNTSCSPPPIDYWVQMEQNVQEDYFDYTCYGSSQEENGYPAFYYSTVIGGCNSSGYICNQNFNAQYNSLVSQCRSILASQRGF
jgi:hypothetical protein